MEPGGVGCPAINSGGTSPKFNSSHLKNDGWKTISFLLGFGDFSGANC